jgi:uncharacterized protein (DUF1778 family)
MSGQSSIRGRRSVASPLMVRLDKESKAFLTKAAALRRLSVSDYVRTITIAQARKDVEAAQSNVLSLSPQEQLDFWNALHEPVKLTPAQKKLGRVMQGRA